MSDMKSYAEYVQGTLKAMLTDVALAYPDLSREFNRDYQRLSSAIECHGVRFALDTMPAFRKHFDQCLDQRRLTHSGLIHFGSGRRGGVIPKLFRGLTLRVFDRDGSLKSEPDIRAIRYLRQLLGVVRKLRLPCSQRSLEEAVVEFLRTDATVRLGSLSWGDFRRFDSQKARHLSFLDLCRVNEVESMPLFGDIQSYADQNLTLLTNVQLVADILTAQLGSFDPADWRFRHGPGAVSDQPYGAYRYAFRRWPDRLATSFPAAEYAFSSYSSAVEDGGCDVVTSEYLSEVPANLRAVPKTITKPRLIASEPSYLQWCQQSIRDYFYTRVRSSFLSQFVDFRRQEKNGDLALQGSHSSELATIDLSEASDRISCWHVERLFRMCPTLLDALQATRSAFIKQDMCRWLPSHSLIRKYSTMGNATTFPVQSLFFLTLAIASVLTVRGVRPSIKSLRSLGSSQIRVFGDDIIIAKDGSAVLQGLLQALSLKVNVNKTFDSGNFRESCGVDAFMGVNVTSINVLDFPVRSKPGTIVSVVDVHNNLHTAGYLHTASYLRKTVPDHIRKRILSVEPSSGLFGWYTYEDLDHSNSSIELRWNKNLHRREARCLRVKTKAHRHPPETSAGLLQFFTEAQEVVDSASSSIGHLSERPKAKLSLGWVPL